MRVAVVDCRLCVFESILHVALCCEWDDNQRKDGWPVLQPYIIPGRVQ